MCQQENLETSWLASWLVQSSRIEKRWFEVFHNRKKDLLTFPISKFCLMSRYKEAEACDLTAAMEEELCLSNLRHKSAQCSEASSNKSEGNLNTKDLWTAKRCWRNDVDWLVPSAWRRTRRTLARSPCEWSMWDTTCKTRSGLYKGIAISVRQAKPEQSSLECRELSCWLHWQGFLPSGSYTHSHWYNNHQCWKFSYLIN